MRVQVLTSAATCRGLESGSEAILSCNRTDAFDTMQVGGSPLNPRTQLCVPAASATTTYMNNGNFRVKNNTPHFLRLSYGPEAVSLTRREELNNGRMAMIAISGICAAELATGKDSDSLTTEGLSQLGVQRMAHLLSQEDQGLAFACRFSVRIPKFPQQLARKLKPISSHIFSHKSGHSR